MIRLALIGHEAQRFVKFTEIPLRYRVYNLGRTICHVFVLYPYVDLMDRFSPSREARTWRAMHKYQGVHPSRIPESAQKLIPHFAALVKDWQANPERASARSAPCPWLRLEK